MFLIELSDQKISDPSHLIKEKMIMPLLKDIKQVEQALNNWFTPKNDKVKQINSIKLFYIR